MKEDSAVSHPQHYTTGFEPVPPECIRVAELMMFRPGNAFKYIWRAGLKEGEVGRLRDLEKALQYLGFITFEYTTPDECYNADEYDNTKARIAFRAIKDDGSWKYSTLKLIVNCQYLDAAAEIAKEIERLKDGKD